MLERFLGDGRAIVGISSDDLAPGPLLVEVIRDLRSGQATVGTIKGPVSEVYTLSVAFLLTSEAGARLRRCGDQKCGRFFLRSGKMEHCSVRCSRRVYMRAYRKSSGAYSGKETRRGSGAPEQPVAAEDRKREREKARKKNRTGKK